MPIDELIPLPADDPDAELARRLDGGEITLSRNSFEDALAQYRHSALESTLPVDLSERLWQNVAPPTRPSLRLVPVWARRTAAAAVIVLVALGAWLLLQEDPAVQSYAGAQISTATLADGSEVTLRPHSTLYRLDDDAYLLEGEAFFRVVSNPRRTFRVQSTFGEIRVLGTRFDVSTWGNETTVFLESGRLVFEHATTGAVDTLAPGNELIASGGGHRVRPAPFGGEGSLDWLSGALLLGRRPVSNILAELEHHFEITVLVPDALKNETLSGQILLSSPRQSLTDLGTALGVRFEETQPDVFRLTVE